MTEYLIPTGDAVVEFTEKRSRFIGHIWPVDSEAQARAYIEQTKKKQYDARHNCWCYLVREEGVVRYSDDGEPQGTAGQPMLGVFQKEGVENVCCVVTRYFGGILLGAGGLVRAYTRSAKDALDAAGTSVVRRWIELMVPCPYSFFERVKLETQTMGGVLAEVEYAEQVTVHALLPEDRVDDFTAKIVELTAGGTQPKAVGEVLKAVSVPRG